MPTDSYCNFSAMAVLTAHFCMYIARTFVWLGGYWRLLSKGLNDTINWISLDVNEKNLNFLLSESWNHLPLQTPVLPWLRRLRWSAITTSSTQSSTWYGLDFHCFNMLNEETFMRVHNRGSQIPLSRLFFFSIPPSRPFYARIRIPSQWNRRYIRLTF